MEEIEEISECELIEAERWLDRMCEDWSPPAEGILRRLIDLARSFDSNHSEDRIEAYIRSARESTVSDSERRTNLK